MELEARRGIAAINAGSHTNPVYAGDTLYAFTEVLDAYDPATVVRMARCGCDSYV